MLQYVIMISLREISLNVTNEKKSTKYESGTVPDRYQWIRMDNRSK